MKAKVAKENEEGDGEEEAVVEQPGVLQPPAGENTGISIILQHKGCMVARLLWEGLNILFADILAKEEEGSGPSSQKCKKGGVFIITVIKTAQKHLLFHGLFAKVGVGRPKFADMSAISTHSLTQHGASVYA